jgi:hypothetical protein
MAKLVSIFQLSEDLERPVRQLRNMVAERKIPYFKIGHRTILFDRQKVEAALARFEIPAVNTK